MVPHWNDNRMCRALARHRHASMRPFDDLSTLSRWNKPGVEPSAEITAHPAMCAGNVLG